MLVRLTLHPAAVPVPTVIVPRPLPTVAHHAALPAGAGLTQLVLVVYLMESAKYRLEERSVGRECSSRGAPYPYYYVLANFGIAMAARMPMITTTINSSMSVRPLRFICSPCWCWMRQRVSNRPQMLQPICLVNVHSTTCYPVTT